MKTIAEHRTQQGLRRMDLAVRLGVDLSTVYRWEAGRVMPSSLARRAIAGGLDVPMEQIDWDRPCRERRQRTAP